MEKNLLGKQEEFLKTYRGLKSAMPLLETEQLIKMTFAYVFRETETLSDAVKKPVDESLQERVHTLRELRLKANISQEKASKEVGKVPSFIGRLESGAIKRLDTHTEKKLLALYKKLEEEKSKET